MCANSECFSLGMGSEFSENSGIMETECPAQAGTLKERFLLFRLFLSHFCFFPSSPFWARRTRRYALLGSVETASCSAHLRRARPAQPCRLTKLYGTRSLPPPPSHCLLPGKLNAVLIHGAMRTHRRRVSLFQRRATVRSSSSSLTSIS